MLSHGYMGWLGSSHGGGGGGGGESLLVKSTKGLRHILAKRKVQKEPVTADVSSIFFLRCDELIRLLKV